LGDSPRSFSPAHTRVEADRTAELERLLRELEERHGDLGARLELTGPWPPYNFVARPTGAPA
jgi:hypothetical protein